MSAKSLERIVRKEIVRAEKEFADVDDFGDTERRAYADGYLEALYFLVNRLDK